MPPEGMKTPPADVSVKRQLNVQKRLRHDLKEGIKIMPLLAAHVRVGLRARPPRNYGRPRERESECLK